MEKSEEVINLLWTGGWDSTFRILQLLLIHRKKVQPFYIIDSDRLSTRMELLTMKHVKQQVFIEFPETKKLLKPTILKEIQEIIPNESISFSFQQLKKRKFIGDQYEWLAWFANQESIEHLELSVVLSDDGPTKLIEEFIQPKSIAGLPTFEVESNSKDLDAIIVFKFFSFPMFYLGKTKMKEKAINFGFFHILSKSWFCHKPLSNNKPCGVCKPCSVVMKTGMEYRMPVYSKARFYFRPFISRKQFRLKFPSVYSFIKRIKTIHL